MGTSPGAALTWLPCWRPTEGPAVIPTLMLAGLLVGRWWLLAVAAVMWPAVLVDTEVGGGLAFVAGAAALAAFNAAAGVAVNRTVRAAFRATRAARAARAFRAARARERPSESRS